MEPLDTDEVDPNATTRMRPFDLERLVQKGSGTRPVITAEQIHRYMKERETLPAPGLEPELEPELEGPPDIRDEIRDEIRERETVDALTLQRETLIIQPATDGPAVQTTAQQIPIDIDLSRLHLPTPRPAAGRPVPFAARLASRLDRRQLTIAGAFLIAMISALLGFVAGRL